MFDLQYTKLYLFNHNNVPNILNLTISNTKLSSMINNTFGYMSIFNISNSKFNDTGLFEIITNNTWLIPTALKIIDLSILKLNLGNNLNIDREKILKKYK